MRLQVEARLAYHMPHTADVLLAVEGAQMTEQRLVKDLLTVSGCEPCRAMAGLVAEPGPAHEAILWRNIVERSMWNEEPCPW
ncbi:hypothetical protein MRBLMC3_001741 [Sphingobium sp. LMC3-1-1.1]|uniref:hypothetical protein n=1 Tax=Sphingobium sp. LMC3-1-1.1 TaxID=3135241 RepID=UPI0034198847